jgi:hypothetical protein
LLKKNKKIKTLDACPHSLLSGLNHFSYELQGRIVEGLNAREKDPTKGLYELGLFSTENSTKYYVGIWYNHVSEVDLVWVANREHSFPNSSVVLTFNPDGNLAISDGRLLHLLTNTSGGNDTYVKLLDTGNLILTTRP